MTLEALRNGGTIILDCVSGSHAYGNDEVYYKPAH